MEAVDCFETLAPIYQTLHRDIPEDSNQDMNLNSSFITYGKSMIKYLKMTLWESKHIVSFKLINIFALTAELVRLVLLVNYIIWKCHVIVFSKFDTERAMKGHQNNNISFCLLGLQRSKVHQMGTDMLHCSAEQRELSGTCKLFRCWMDNVRISELH